MALNPHVFIRAWKKCTSKSLAASRGSCRVNSLLLGQWQGIRINSIIHRIGGDTRTKFLKCPGLSSRCLLFASSDLLSRFLKPALGQEAGDCRPHPQGSCALCFLVVLDQCSHWQEIKGEKKVDSAYCVPKKLLKMDGSLNTTRI